MRHHSREYYDSLPAVSSEVGCVTIQPIAGSATPRQACRHNVQSPPAPDGRVYAPPFHADGVLCIDVVRGSASEFGSWQGGAEACSAAEESRAPRASPRKLSPDPLCKLKCPRLEACSAGYAGGIDASVGGEAWQHDGKAGGNVWRHGGNAEEFAAKRAMPAELVARARPWQ
eukprot:gene17689-biopygen1726